MHVLSVARALVCALLLSGCGGASQMVLKDPIAEKCTSSGLEGCDELTDGILLYVDGKKVEGEAKLKLGVAANAPDKVKGKRCMKRRSSAGVAAAPCSSA